MLEALERCGISAEPAVWSEGLAEAVRPQLLGADGVLVWVNPVDTTTGEGHGALDALLREVVDTGVFVSAHPDVTNRMGTKEVLYWTRSLE